MKLIGRRQEIEILDRIYQADEAQFLALYGRRRVGKTFLIKQFFQHKDSAIFFNVTGLKKGKMQEQIKHFTTRFSEVFYSKHIKLENPKSWDEALALLTSGIKEQESRKKIIIFFDELPWLVTKNSRLLQQIDYYWNQYWSDNPQVKLIICGSSASWIIKKVINDTGGLHNRITDRILLTPFNLNETAAYLNSKNIFLNYQQIVLIYMVTGGVPYYLSKIKWQMSAMQIIEKLAFSKKAFFLDEFDNLFSSLFDGHETHVNIVRTLSKNRYGIGKRKLLESVGAYGGNSAARLQELEDAGFIMSFRPVYHKKRGIYYRLIDEYCFFYLKWIEPIKDLLNSQALDNHEWQAIQSTPEWNSWLGYAFESVCYKHLLQIKRVLNLPPMSLSSSWRYSPIKNSRECGAQIDLLFDRRDDAITICEIKYSNQPFVITKSYFEKLQQKIDVFSEKTKTKKQLFLVIVAANGIKKNIYSRKLVSGVVVLDDLFKDK